MVFLSRIGAVSRIGIAGFRRTPVLQRSRLRFQVGKTPISNTCRFLAGYKEPDKTVEEPMLDSWVCPDALFAHVMGDEQQGEPDPDERFVQEFGQRNLDWRERMLAKDAGFFKNISLGQAPEYLWIGCSDSRVAAENMIDGRPGELFVHRNVANLVVNTDFNFRAVLKYAVEFLKVDHIIVCGHYDCGGVRAAFQNEDHQDPLESWLTHIRDVYRYHQQELDAIIDPEERHKRFVELNVIEQCLNLFKTSDVQRRRTVTGNSPDQYECAFPRIHAMVFEPSDGILRRLPIDFKQYIQKYKKVYQLYDHTNVPALKK